MYIRYKKVKFLDIKIDGYNESEIETVQKRYLKSYEDYVKNKNTYYSLPNIKDLTCFLKDECIPFWSRYKKMKILDVGCGSGMHSKIFQDKKILNKKMTYTGCEINQNFVDTCLYVNKHVNFFISKADKIKSSDKAYDIVFSSSVLHYTLNEWKKSLEEMMRVTDKYILITRFPLTKHNNTFYVHQTVSSTHGMENHYFIVISRREFESFIKSIGLRILARDYSQEVYPVDGISENVMLCEYLLSR